jgi:AcrR family transcriptional regulator
MFTNPTKKDIHKKRAAILQTGSSLIMKHGIERISVEEICREAGVSKMTFYKYFNNKQVMIDAILKDLFQTLESRIEAIRKSDLSYQEKIKAFIRLKLDQAAPLGWQLFKEFSGGRGLAWLNEIKAWNEKIIRGFLDDMKEKTASGEIRTNLNPETFLYIVERMTEWMADERFVSRYVTVEALATKMMNFLFYGFLGAIEEK